MGPQFTEIAEVMTGATVEGVFERDADTWGTHDVKLTLSNGQTVTIKSIGGQLSITHAKTRTDRR